MGRTRGPAGVALLACLCLLFAARADAHKQHKYEEGAHVPLYSAKIGPFANPSVTYEFYTLPFCKPENGVKYKRLGLGEAVDANRCVGCSVQGGRSKQGQPIQSRFAACAALLVSR